MAESEFNASCDAATDVAGGADAVPESGDNNFGDAATEPAGGAEGGASGDVDEPVFALDTFFARTVSLFFCNSSFIDGRGAADAGSLVLAFGSFRCPTSSEPFVESTTARTADPTETSDSGRLSGVAALSGPSP